MFNNISWQGYWLSLALVSASYYLVVYLLYFRSDFKITLPRKIRPHHPGVVSSATATGSNPAHSSFLEKKESDFEMPPPDSEERVVYGLMDELTAYFEVAEKSRCVKEELNYSLQRILSKYPTLTTSQYRESITSVVASEAEHLCSIHISSDELDQVWLGT
jgi:hypothetical protein